jgi:hypothetical protein
MDLSFLGPSAAVVIVVLLFLKFLTNVFDKLIATLDRLSESNKSIAEATNKSAVEAEKRNGHLAELAIENHQNTVKAIQSINTQHVDVQRIDHQTINRTDG